MGQVSQRIDSISEATRARLGEPQRIAYGPSAIERLDIYRTKRANAPVFVFIHGGRWRNGSARHGGFAAEMFVDHGAHYVALDFTNVVDAGGDLRVIRRGIAWVYKNAGSFGGRAGSISAAIHQAAICAALRW
jgi:arylformamidase